MYCWARSLDLPGVKYSIQMDIERVIEKTTWNT